jgi:hypothetical protein
LRILDEEVELSAVSSVVHLAPFRRLRAGCVSRVIRFAVRPRQQATSRRDAPPRP